MSGKVSIIVPVYNAEQYLGQCIDSILHQTYTNFELLLINDGSTDRSASICEEYRRRDNRVKVWHKPNSGVSASRNFGLSVATGEYILFVDNDDWLAETHIQALYELLVHTNSDIAIGNFCQFIEDEAVFLIHTNEESYFEAIYQPLEWFNYQYTNDYCLSQCFTVPWAKLYKRELFENIVYPTGRKVEDDYTTYKVYLLANQIAFMNQAIYIHRKRTTSVTRQVLQSDVYPLNSIEERLTLLSLITNSDNEIIQKELSAYKWRLELHKRESLEKGDIEAYKQTLVKMAIIEKYS